MKVGIFSKSWIVTVVEGALVMVALCQWESMALFDMVVVVDVESVLWLVEHLFGLRGDFSMVRVHFSDQVVQGWLLMLVSN